DTTRYAYDPNGRLLRTTDPTGLKTWCLYDADGRKIADIDGAGDVTEYDYDASGLVTRTVRHGSALAAADLATLDGLGNPTLAAIHLSYSAASDRASWNVYDTAGRLRQTIDARGAVVQLDYDGAGRVMATTAFANRVDTSHFGVAPSFVNITASTSPSTSQADRVTRNYYDEDGLLVGVLDADNYLTTYQHDADGRVTVTTRYATQIASVGVESTLAEILPAPAVDDQRSVTLYDLAGRVAGTVDAEGYLTQNSYDPTTGDLASQTRYATPVGSAVDPRSALSGLVPADDPNDQVTSFTYDSHHRVTQQTGPDGTVTKYSYSTTGDQLLSTDVAPGKSDERLVTQALDGDGRVLDAVSGIGGHLRSVHDAAGRLLSTTDAAGRVTRYFYDDAGRLRYTVAATADATTTAAPGTVPGAVTEVQYDAFGQVTRTLRYLKTVDLASIGTGCVLSKLASNPFTALTGTTAATRTTSYLVSGLVNAVTDEAGYATTTADADYDAFGDVLARTTALAGGVTRNDQFTYDHRGNVLTSELDHGGLGVKTSAQYDAFGRQVQATDALDNVTTTAYDHRGNVIQRTDPLNPASTWTYDAFDRVLSASLAGADPTTYAYDRAARTTTVTQPGLAPTVTAYDDQGRVSTVRDANGHVTATTYDAEGHVTRVSVDGTATYAARYDAAGRLVTSQDGAGIANGVWTHYTYDAANRLRMTQGPTGQRQWMLYDEAGRVVGEVDALGHLSEYRYDAAGRLVQTLGYEQPLNTALLLDAQGQPADVSLAAIRPAPSANDRRQWQLFDAAGRLTHQVNSLGEVTETQYDGAGRITTVIQHGQRLAALPSTNTSSGSNDLPVLAYAATGDPDRIARSLYDADGLLRATLDAEGSLTEMRYDAAGHLVERIAYATATDPAQRAAGTLAQLIPTASADDRRCVWLYDSLGRQVAEIAPEGWLTETSYNAAGQRSQSLRYARRISGSATSTSTLAGLRPAASTEDQRTAWTYDALNRVATETAADGTLTRYGYDNAGNLTSTERAAGTPEARRRTQRYDLQGRLVAELSGEGSVRLAQATTQAQIDAVWSTYATQHAYDAAGRRIRSTDARGNTTVYYYDAAGRLAYTILKTERGGEVQMSRYNGFGETTTSIRYTRRLGTADTAALTGGQADAALDAKIAALADGSEARTQASYNQRGLIQQAIDALGFKTTSSYDAFGQLSRSEAEVGATPGDGRVLRTDY
ncbi:MAG TPA: hypothetical protein VIP05_24535, partial [Burkholderiaceae bacterium]